MCHEQAALTIDQKLSRLPQKFLCRVSLCIWPPPLYGLGNRTIEMIEVRTGRSRMKCDFLTAAVVALEYLNVFLLLTDLQESLPSASSCTSVGGAEQ